MRISSIDYRFIFTSLTRIANLENGFQFDKVNRRNWRNGDYVVCEVAKVGGSTVRAELSNGRMMQMMEGNLIVGALGVRHATLEATGDWKKVGEDGSMHMLTGAGLFGKMTSRSVFITPMIELKYLGHVFVDGDKKNMKDYVTNYAHINFDIPVILFVGTSMSSGKTTSARIITRQLKLMKKKVVCAKLTGAGRYRDILSVKDAGADFVCDFVDAGLPSSICSESRYREALQIMLALIKENDPDVAVIEIGASPLEPYNGEIAINSIKDQVQCTVLCASDPYAVLGVMKGFHIKPDIVSGPAVNTLAGAELVQKLCNVRALNLIDSENLPGLRSILQDIFKD